MKTILCAFLVSLVLLSGCYESNYPTSYLISETPPEQTDSKNR